jgi:uncharacterized protein (DUF4415 family)
MQQTIRTRSGRQVIVPTDEEDVAITKAAKSDPDAQPLTDAELAQLRPLRGRPPSAVKRPMLSMRIDPDVLAHLRASGKGWQTKVNALIRQAVEQGKV